jgi:hypothetical protein
MHLFYQRTVSRCESGTIHIVIRQKCSDSDPQRTQDTYSSSLIKIANLRKLGDVWKDEQRMA